MKRPLETELTLPAPPKRHEAAADDNWVVGAALKVLLSSPAVRRVRTPAGGGLAVIESLSGTRMSLSDEGVFYPGTDFRELAICGSTPKAVRQALGMLSQQAGLGEDGTRASLRVVVPVETADDLQAPGAAGEELRRLNHLFGLVLQVEQPPLPLGPPAQVAEQVVTLMGSAEALEEGLYAVASLASLLAAKPWFAAWARSSASEAAVAAGGYAASGESSPTPICAFAMKLLVAEQEAQILCGSDGDALLQEIQVATNVVVALSADGAQYPGTSLYEYNVQGPSHENVVAAAVQLLTAVLENLGTLNCGEPLAQSGYVRVRSVLPSKAAAALIGPGGQTVKQVRTASLMHVHVETTAIPPGPTGDLSEQVVTLHGPGGGVQMALSLVAEVMLNFAQEPWFKAWSHNTHCGKNFSGMALFGEGKGGKGKGKLKGSGKFGKSCNGGGYGGMALKLLLAPHEGSCLVGRGGATIREIGMATGTKLTLSNQGQFYPGTGLQELRVLGSTREAVINAALQGLNKVAEELGTLANGELGVEPGGARVKMAVPVRCAAAIIGPGGTQVTFIRSRSGMHIHVDETKVPPGIGTDTTEQVVALSGPCDGVPVALTLIAEAVGGFAHEHWFDSWASNSLCGMDVPGLVLFNGKAKGKGLGKPKGGKALGGWTACISDAQQAMSIGLTGSAGGAGDLVQGALAALAGQNQQYEEEPSRFAEGGAHMSAIADKSLDLPASLDPDAKGGPMAFKLLLSADEVSVLSRDPTTMKQIQTMTNTIGMISEQFYPGSRLYELCIQGPTPESVYMTVVAIVGKIGEVMGVVSSGDIGVEPGFGRVKAVLPKRSAASLIGVGGQNVRNLKQQTGINVSVDTTAIQCTEYVSEQAVLLRGPLNCMQPAIEVVVLEVANHMNELWFHGWANHSNCGLHIPGYTILATSKGKGKGEHD